MLSPKFRLTARIKAGKWGCYKFSEPQNYNSEARLVLTPENPTPENPTPENPNPESPEHAEQQQKPDESNMKIEVPILKHMETVEIIMSPN